jgi:hypothetical protein
MAFCAAPSHLAEVFDAAGPWLAEILRHGVRLARQFAGRPHIVAWRRFLPELRIVVAAFRAHRRAVRLVLLTSSTSTGIVAAQIAAGLLLSRGPVASAERYRQIMRRYVPALC